MKKRKNSYHHGNLAESLLNAVDEIATQFGLEAVTLRGCAKLVGVSPSSAFRHYADKRALLTAFATRALRQLAGTLADARLTAKQQGENEFLAVSMAYVGFAVEKPAFFRAMWRKESIYMGDQDYQAALERLSAHLKDGFANTIQDSDPGSLSAEELLAWSTVHGLAHLLIDGPVADGDSQKKQMALAMETIEAIFPAIETSAS